MIIADLEIQEAYAAVMRYVRGPEGYWVRS